MRVATKHFFFRSERDFWHGERWYVRSIRIGLFARVVGGHEIPYQVGMSLNFWLIPNFIWEQNFLCMEHGRPVYQTRIIGIQSWPFRLNLFRFRSEKPNAP